MTVRRWATTTVAMAGLGVALALLAPDRALVASVLAGPQQLVDARGADVLVVVLAWALAALCWAWGLLGLVLTGLSTVPGMAGRVAGVVLLVLLPAGARRAAAVAVGLSLATGAVLVPSGVASADPAAPIATVTADAVPDWSTAEPPAPVPDWPTAPSAEDHVVLRGDCLWDVAEAWLTARSGGVAPTTGDVADAVAAWHRANADVIGPDPDLLLPGQVLTAPPAP